MEMLERAYERRGRGLKGWNVPGTLRNRGTG
jgi:hypothetical protein